MTSATQDNNAFDVEDKELPPCQVDDDPAQAELPAPPCAGGGDLGAPGNASPQKQEQSSSDDSNSKLERQESADRNKTGWRRVVRNFTPSWFSVNMGTGQPSASSAGYPIPQLIIDLI